MNNFDLKDLEGLKWLIDLKNNKPEEYKKFFCDVKDIFKDMIKLMGELQNE